MNNPGRVLVALALACLMGGCHTQPGSRQSGDAERRAINLAVLAYMVEHYELVYTVEHSEEVRKLVRYVDLQPPEIRQLRHLCGHRFQIAPLSDSERTGGCLLLPDSIKKGVLLRAKIMSLSSSQAEVTGVYNRGPGHWDARRYTLRKENGAWRVTSMEYSFPSLPSSRTRRSTEWRPSGCWAVWVSIRGRHR